MPSYDLAINIGGKANTQHIQQAGKEVESFGKRLEGNLSLIKNSAAAALAAGATFQQAFELSKEGAQINQLTESFELMNEQVFKTPDLLNDMTDAVNGTIKETDLMKSLLTLTAGASNDAAQAYAAAAPQLLEIAKASNKLNPALGDTAFLFDSLALGIKRGSPLILDNLGITIKVGEANEKYAASIGKSVDALTAEEKQMALLNAVMESGDQLISQVGGNVDSQADAWARLTVKVGESTDSFKQWLANGLYPVIEALSDGYGGAVENVVDKNIETAQSMNDLVKAGQRMTRTLDDVGAAGLKVTGTYDQFQAGLRATAMAIIENSNGAIDARKNLEAAFGPDLFKNVDEMGLTFIDLGLGVSIFVDEIDRASDHSSRFGEDLAALNRMSAEYTVVTGTGAVGAASDFGAALANLTQIGAAAQQQQNALNQEMNAMTVGGLRDVESAIGDPIRALLAAQQQLADSQGEWVQVTYSNASEISGINAELANDLTTEQANAYREIVRTAEEGSADWLAAYNALQGDLSDSQRQALIAQRAELEAVGDTVGSAYTGSIKDAEAAQAAIDEANQAIIDSYRELAFEGALALAEISPDPDAVQRALDYAVAIGQITQEEADMRLQAVETRTAIDDLNKLVVQAGLDTEIAGRAFDLLTSGQYNTAESARQAAEKQQLLIDLFAQTPEKVATAYTLFTGDSIQRLQEIKGLLDGLDGRSVSSSASVNTFVPGDLGGGSADGGKDGKYATGTGGQYVTVPSGYPNDSYNIGLTSGERFRVATPGESIDGGSNITIYINGATLPPNPQAQARQLATAVAEEMGRVK